MPQEKFGNMSPPTYSQSVSSPKETEWDAASTAETLVNIDDEEVDTICQCPEKENSKAKQAMVNEDEWASSVARMNAMLRSGEGPSTRTVSNNRVVRMNSSGLSIFARGVSSALPRGQQDFSPDEFKAVVGSNISVSVIRQLQWHSGSNLEHAINAYFDHLPEAVAERQQWEDEDGEEGERSRNEKKKSRWKTLRKRIHDANYDSSSEKDLKWQLT